VNKGPADLLRQPARPRPGTVVVEPEAETEGAAEESTDSPEVVSDAVETTETDASDTPESKVSEPEDS
jgi:hypothetical protein